tara:strand:+ start:321 stop:971 length:651 start_codon:yes stop_codon:yes gene_type:complete
MDDLNMVGNEELFSKLVKYVKREVPDFEIKSKKESRLMKLLSVVLFFNKDFLTRYITTIYPYIYVPSLPWYPNKPVGRISILAHEYVHLYDRKRLGWLFNILYLSPQIFAPLALGAFWNLWWLLALLFLLPLPSPGRTWLEFRGYRMTAAIHWWLNGQRVNTVWLEQQFTGSAYYWMFPFKRFITNRILKAVENIENDKYLPPEIFEIKTILGVQK